MTRRPITVINLGGEGESPGVVNQQHRAVLSAGWLLSRPGMTLEQLAAQGHDFLICDNTDLPINDGSVDLVITNSVPVDVVTYAGPGVQSSEINRILASGGHWLHDGKVWFIRP